VLVGPKRAREVREFLDKDLGPECLSAWGGGDSDEPPREVTSQFVRDGIANISGTAGRTLPSLMMDKRSRVLPGSPREIGWPQASSATRGYPPQCFRLIAQW